MTFSDSASTTDDLTSATRDTVADEPHKSLIEEALERQEAKQVSMAARFETQPGEIDPLRPPGYTGPNYGPPSWVLPAVGVGVVALIAIILAIALSFS